MVKYTYQNIGNAYRYVKEIESIFTQKFVSEIAILSQDIVKNSLQPAGDFGASRILLEEKYLFELIDAEGISNKYKLIILPDNLIISEEIKDKLSEFLRNGGKLLVSGESAIENGKFIFDLGAEYKTKDKFCPTYFKTKYDIKYLSEEAMAVYCDSYNIKLTGKLLAEKIPPYFQREGEKFCSHYHTPCDYSQEKSPAITEGKDGIYISTQIFTDYYKNGCMNSKLMVVPLIDKLIEKRTVITNLPSQAKISLAERKGEYILHMLYANTIKRGDGIEIIEDIVPIYNINISIQVAQNIIKVKLFPQNYDIPFEYKDGRVEFFIKEMRIHQGVRLFYN